MFSISVLVTRPCHMYGCPSGLTCDYSSGECTCPPPGLGPVCLAPEGKI